MSEGISNLVLFSNLESKGNKSIISDEILDQTWIFNWQNIKSLFASVYSSSDQKEFTFNKITNNTDTEFTEEEEILFKRF